MGEFFYDSIYIILTALTTLFYYSGVMGIEKVAPVSVAASLLPALFFALLRNRKGRVRLVLFAVLLALIAGLLLGALKRPDLFSAESFWTLYPFLLLSALSYAAGRALALFSPVRLLAAAGLMVLFVVSLMRLIRPIPAGVFCLMLLFILLLADEQQAHWKREGFTNRQKHVLSVFPILCLTVIAVSLIKYPSKPYDWKPFVKAWERICDGFDRFSFAFLPGTDTVIGFSDSSLFADDLKKDKEEILKVEAPLDLNIPVYLIGSTYDTFSPSGWQCKNRYDEPLQTIDTIESMNSFKGSKTHIGDYYRTYSFKITYLDAKSKYLFTPQKPTVQDPMGNVSVTQQSGSFMFKKKNPYKLEVMEAFLLANSDNPAFYTYMQDENIITEKVWEQAVTFLPAFTREYDYSYQDYLKCQEKIRKIYTEKVTLSPELSEWMKEISAGSSGDYETLKRIESELSEMEYSLSPAPLPGKLSSSEYLDYFLLKGRSGYCSHYATAFVLLARSMGLPARYMQGYRIDIGKKGTYIVTSDQAHAWPEVYFEGKGWITFEPTPGFHTPANWLMSNQKTPSMKVDYRAPGRLREAEPAEPEEEVGEQEPEPLLLTPLAGLQAAGLVLLIFILVLTASKLNQRRRYRRLSERGRFLSVAADCLRILKQLGSALEPGETLSEYRDRILEQAGEKPLSFIPAYELMLYAKEPPEHGMETLLESRKLLLGRLKKERKWQYLLRLIFG